MAQLRGGYFARAIELNADLIAFDRRLCSRLMECNAGQIVSMAGIIRPAEQVEMGGRESVLKIKAKAMVDGYLYRQSRGSRLLNQLCLS